MRGRKTPADGGNTVVHTGRGLCDCCWSFLIDTDGLLDYPRLTVTANDVLDDYVILRADGYTWRQCATKLDMSYVAFERAMYRARKNLDPRAGRVGETWPPRKKA